MTSSTSPLDQENIFAQRFHSDFITRRTMGSVLDERLEETILKPYTLYLVAWYDGLAQWPFHWGLVVIMGDDSENPEVTLSHSVPRGTDSGPQAWKFEQKPYRLSESATIVQLFEISAWQKLSAPYFMSAIVTHGMDVVEAHIDNKGYDCTTWTRDMLIRLADDKHIDLPGNLDDFFQVFIAKANELQKLREDLAKQQKEYRPKVLKYNKAGN